MNEDIKWQGFKGMYKAYWDMWNPDEELGWQGFVEKSDWTILKTVIEKLGVMKEKERVAAGRSKPHAPKLGEVQRVYFYLLKASKDEAPRNDNCSCCEKTGSILIVERLHPENRLMYSSSPQPITVLELGIYSVPCSCSHGAKSSKDFKQTDRNIFALNSFGPACKSDFRARKFIEECGALFEEEQKAKEKRKMLETAVG